MSLGNLTEAADVSVRTVRYYIAEGLLPPPEGSGPGSSYSQGHLDRLRLIQRMKEAYLPLKEIRRQLSGLDDAEVRTILATGEQGKAQDASYAAACDESLAGARSYLALLEARERYRTEPMALSIPPSPSPAPAQSLAQGDNLVPEASPRLARASVRGTAEPILEARLPEEPDHERGEAPALGRDQGLWRRIPLGDEAELVISDRVYARHRDRIDWLVRWARKVFD